ncbi:MAG: hypothetical protein AAFU79_09685 [Myxococcota bacterium]
MRILRRGATSALLVVGLLSSVRAEARSVHGATIPDGAEPTGQVNQFIARRPWNKIMTELRRTYRRVPGVVFRRVSTPPRIRAWYIQNTRAGRTWDGINVYEDLAKRTVYLSVLPSARRR